MSNYKIIFLYLLLFFSNKILSQNCKYEGKTNFNDSICWNYVFETHLKDSIPYYISKYYIVQKSVLIYKVEFQVFDANDSIFITIRNDQNDINKQINIRYDNQYFPTLINYHTFNDTLNCYEISIDTINFKILFTIPDYLHPHVRLNKFQSINDSSISYNIFPLKQIYIDKSIENSKAYWATINRLKHQRETDSLNVLNTANTLKYKMEKYKNHLIDSVSIIEDSLKKGLPIYVNGALKTRYKEILDSVFWNSTIDNPQFINANLNVLLNIYFDTNGYLQKDKTLSETVISGIGDSISFKKKYLTSLLNNIGSIKFKSMFQIFTNNDIVINFEQAFKNDTLNLYKMAAGFNSIYKTKWDVKTEKEIDIEAIKIELSVYKKRIVNVPTLYSGFSIIYKSVYDHDLLNLYINDKPVLKNIKK